MDKRDAILNSALELFISRGFDNTSTTLITKNAGVGTGTLFNHFNNKVELINSLYLSIKKEIMDVLRLISAYEMITEDVMRLLWQLMVRWGLENPEKMRFIRQYNSSPYITSLTREQQEAESLLLKSQTQKAVEEGVLKDYPVDLIMEASFSLMHTLIFYLLRTENYDEDLIESMFPLVWDLIKK
jgi:AcrR family transcriptional regulator